jgi:arsenate reductase-like glutaredoxin family protein
LNHLPQRKKFLAQRSGRGTRRARLREVDVFAGRDPRDFLNQRSPAFKAMGLAGKTLSAEQALALMAKEPNLIKRPIVIAGKQMIAGFDRDKLRAALK